ncbi:MAG: 50S ribosomal protein L10 [Chloroflexi bacterium]|nr:50S ribosomal protein L10 [Chloroflexota bacterium]MDQ3407487.1 50S ribosomal protein L10 [Chloroflexota bacterium]
MPTEAKRATVAELVEAFSNSDRAIVSDHRGLTVSDLSAVRRALRAQGITYRVVKNRLARIAADEAGRGELSSLLDGPTAVALGGQDEAALAKGLIEALRPHRAVVIRGGVIGNSRIDGATVARLATLPSRDQLLGQLAGGIASPLGTMAALLIAPLRNLGYGLTQLRDQREGAGPA